MSETTIKEYEITFAQGKLTVMASNEAKAIQTAREVIPKFYDPALPVNPVTAKLVDAPPPRHEGRPTMERRKAKAKVERRPDVECPSDG